MARAVHGVTALCTSGWTRAQRFPLVEAARHDDDHA
jgi:hypothetical protein